MTLALLCFLLTGPLLANDTYGSVTGVQLNSCYDGDTCRFDIPEWPPIVGDDISVRIAGLDTPEIRGNCTEEKEKAQTAREIVVTLLTEADTITLKNIQRRKYFRLVAEVHADEYNVAQLLIDKGLARPYEGGSREEWCETSDTSPTGSESNSEPAEDGAASKVIIRKVDLQKEQVVIQNQGSDTVELSGWTLVSVKGDQRYSFPDGYRLEPSQRIMVTSGPDAKEAPPYFLRWTGTHIWNNDGDPARLVNEEGEVVSQWDG